MLTANKYMVYKRIMSPTSFIYLLLKCSDQGTQHIVAHTIPLRTTLETCLVALTSIATVLKVTWQPYLLAWMSFLGIHCCSDIYQELHVSTHLQWWALWDMLLLRTYLRSRKEGHALLTSEDAGSTYCKQTN